MSDFILHPQLESDSLLVTDLDLCTLRLINDANYPWFILVPKVNNIVEVIDLSDAQQTLLWQESAFLSHVIKQIFTPDKLNIAALGNMVPQLHLHHIARYRGDVSWPNPVWGQYSAKPYSSKRMSEITHLVKSSIEARSDT